MPSAARDRLGAIGEVEQRSAEPQQEGRAGEERLPDGRAVAVGLDPDHPADALPVLLAVAPRDDQQEPGDEVRAGERQPDGDPAPQADAADRHRSAGELLLDELGEGAGGLRDAEGRLWAARAAERRELRYQEVAVRLQLRQ